MVYMKQQLFCSEEDLYFIIWVDRFRFESVWFKSSSTYAPELARGNEKAWRNDYKFHHAEHGFEVGIDNPVPLAILSADKYFPNISFIDGITRTIWLMANRAQYFPVFAYNKESAENIYNYIGIKGSRIFSNNELVNYLKNKGF